CSFLAAGPPILTGGSRKKRGRTVRSKSSKAVRTEHDESRISRTARPGRVRSPSGLRPRWPRPHRPRSDRRLPPRVLPTRTPARTVLPPARGARGTSQELRRTQHPRHHRLPERDRKSVVEGKRVSPRG